MNHLLKVTFLLGAATALIGGASYGCDRYHHGGAGEECFRDGTCSFGLACIDRNPNSILSPSYVCERRESK